MNRIIRKTALVGALALTGVVVTSCETSDEFWEGMAMATETLAYELATTCTWQTDYRGVLYQQCPNGCQVYANSYGGTYSVCPGDYYVAPPRHHDDRWRDRDGRGHDRDRDRDRDRHDRDDHRDHDRD